MALFPREEIYATMSEVKGFMCPDERVSNFVADMFETAKDGVVEIYEMMDFLLVVRGLPRPLTRESVKSAMDHARVHGVARPWHYDADGNCSMPQAVETVKGCFKDMDANGDGVLDNREVYDARP